MSATGIAQQPQPLLRSVSPGAAVATGPPPFSPLGEKRPLPAVAPMLLPQQQPTLQQQQLLKLQEQRSIQQIQQQLMASAPPMPQAALGSPSGGVLFSAGSTSPASSPPVRKRLKMDMTGAQQQQQLLSPQRQNFGQVGSILMQPTNAPLTSSLASFASATQPGLSPSASRPTGQRSPGGSSPSHSVVIEVGLERGGFGGLGWI